MSMTPRTSTALVEFHSPQPTDSEEYVVPGENELQDLDVMEEDDMENTMSNREQTATDLWQNLQAMGMPLEQATIMAQQIYRQHGGAEASGSDQPAPIGYM